MDTDDFGNEERSSLSTAFRFDKASAGTLLAHRPDRLVKINWKSIGFDVFDYLLGTEKEIYRGSEFNTGEKPSLSDLILG